MGGVCGDNECMYVCIWYVVSGIKLCDWGVSSRWHQSSTCIQACATTDLRVAAMCGRASSRTLGDRPTRTCGQQQHDGIPASNALIAPRVGHGKVAPDEVVHEDGVRRGVPVRVVRGVVPARLRRVQDARTQGSVRTSRSRSKMCIRR